MDQISPTPPRQMSLRAWALFAGLLLICGGQVWGRQSPPAAQARGQALGKQIQDSLAKGDLAAAQRLVPEFLHQPRLPIDTLLPTGVSLAQYELYPEAADVFGRCVNDFPNLFEGYYNLALAELALRKYPEALATLAKAPRTAPAGEVARTYLRGKIEAALGKSVEAERDLSAAFAAAPREENYALDLGLYYVRAYKYREALAVFQKATRLLEDSPFLELGLGLTQFLGGQTGESAETCRTLLALQPDFSPARVMMAYNLYMQGKIDEAAKIAEQGLRDPHPFPYLYYLHAVCLIKLQSKDYHLILNDLSLAVQAIPNCSLCYLAISKIHEREGDQNTATADLEKAVGMDPTYAEAWYRLASLYEQTGNHGAAQQARHRFQELQANKTDRDTEMLRKMFLNALGGEGSP
jgi:tetratricopeptide (TPR) repeat protein